MKSHVILAAVLVSGVVVLGAGLAYAETSADSAAVETEATTEAAVETTTHTAAQVGVVAESAKPVSRLEVLQASPVREADGTIALNNRVCPVMGGPVSGTDTGLVEGVRYHFCCPACETQLRADTAKYGVDKAEVEAALGN